MTKHFFQTAFYISVKKQEIEKHFRAISIKYREDGPEKLEIHKIIVGEVLLGTEVLAVFCDANAVRYVYRNGFLRHKRNLINDCRLKDISLLQLPLHPVFHILYDVLPVLNVLILDEMFFAAYMTTTYSTDILLPTSRV